jgi:hypothetical protein
MNTKLFRWFLAFAGFGLVAGCAAPAAAIPEPVLPAASYTGPLTTTVVYDHGGITLTAPSGASAPAVSWADAYTANCKSGDAICDLSQSPTIYLANATVTRSGQLQKDGSLEPLMIDKLVYVLKWTNAPCTQAGPVPSPGSKAGPRPNDSCTLINLIDAGTGKVLYSVEGANI